MPPFKRRALYMLERLYRVVGKSAPNFIQTEVPLTVVHDVSREAELASGVGEFGGWFLLDLPDTLGAGATGREQIDPYTQALAISPAYDNRIEIDVHLYAVSVLVQTAALAAEITSLSVALLGDASDTIPEAGVGWNLPLFEYTTAAGSSLVVSNFTAGGDLVLLLNEGSAVNDAAFPLYIPPGTRITMRTVVTALGAQTVNCRLLCWAGARGVPAP